MTEALVLIAHPCEESFSADLHRTVVDQLSARWWEVDNCDLNAEGLSPVLTAADLRACLDAGPNMAPVQGYVDRVLAAGALVPVFPVWNVGLPAILKGFFDQVLLPGVSFRLEDGLVKPNPTRIRKLAAVTTHGGTRMRALLAGDPPRHGVKHTIWHVGRPEYLRYLALYDMNRATNAHWGAFLGRVGSEMGRL